MLSKELEYNWKDNGLPSTNTTRADNSFLKGGGEVEVGSKLLVNNDSIYAQ